MAGKCPMCKKPEAAPFKPFCCKRCADIDLGRWLKEGYAIKGQDGDAMLPANDRDDGGDL